MHNLFYNRGYLPPWKKCYVFVYIKIVFNTRNSTEYLNNAENNTKLGNVVYKVTIKPYDINLLDASIKSKEFIIYYEMQCV